MNSVTRRMMRVSDFSTTPLTRLIDADARKLQPSLCQNCVRYRMTPGQTPSLTGNSDTYRCCGKWLMGPALMRFGGPARAAGIFSKRAPSTTRTSLRVFRINGLRAARDQNSAKPPFTHIQSDISRGANRLPRRDPSR
jgi:hypothetical protein